MSVESKLKPHLGSDEKLLETHVEQRPDGTLSRAIAITNQRLIRLRESQGANGRETQEVKAILLHGPHILGTNVEKKTGTDPDQGQLIMGLVVGAIGAVVTMLALNVNPLLTLFGVVGTGLGGYIAYDALDTDPGEVWLEILNTGERKGVALPEGAGELAETASRVVVSANS